MAVTEFWIGDLMEFELHATHGIDSLLPQALRRAHALLDEGAVSGLQVDEFGNIEASVREHGVEHRVRVFVDRDPQTGAPDRCSCSENFCCRHVGAVRLLLADPGRFASEDLGARLAADRIRSWLRAISKSGTEATPKPRTNASVVIYVLRPAHLRDLIQVKVMQARIRKRDGSYGRPIALSTQNVLRGAGAQCVTDDDRHLIEQLALFGRARYDSDYALEARCGQLLLEIVRTGRCFALDTESEPLREGGERVATPSWSLDDAGRQTPSVAVEGGGNALLFDHPLWMDDQSIGPLRVSHELELLRRFQDGPTLNATIAAVLSAEVRTEFVDLQLPAPRALEVVVREPQEPQLGVVCYTKRTRTRYSGALTVDAVHPFARYGEQVVSLSEADEWLESCHEQRVERVRRDLAFEATLLETLASLGFTALLETVPARWTYDMERALVSAGGQLDMTLNRVCHEVDEPAWQHFVERVVPELREAGLEVRFDDEFRFGYVRAERVFAGVTSTTGQDWFDVELGVELGETGERVDLSPVLHRLLSQAQAQASTGDETRVEVDGVTIVIPTERLQRIAAALIEFSTSEPQSGNGRVRLLDRQVATLAELESSVDAFDWGEADVVRDLARRLADFDGVDPIQKPSGCKARMRKYQREGLAWLQFLSNHELHGILADDMGLGKTLQVLSHILVEKDEGRADRPSIVFAPTSVASNWVAEASRFAPSLTVLLLHGPDRGRLQGQIGDADLVVSTYPLALRDTEVFEQHEFHLLVLDEAQAIKNARSKIRRALQGIDARHRLCLTGTPLENNLTELWSQFDFLMPGLLGSASSFGRTFRAPIERRNDEAARSALLRRIRPFVLRRTKEQVLRQLPPKTEIVHAVEFGKGQRDLYDSIRVAMHERVQEAIDSAGINRAQIVILDALLKLRQVCCDPGLVKLASARKVKSSAKLDELMDLLPVLIADGRRILLFSQFTTMLSKIEARLRDAAIDFVKLTGSTKDRATPVERFQRGEVPVFLISLKAGGTGLNLTAADTVIHYDPWWNPAVERQASDRAHRIGQQKPVFVYRLIVSDSVEEKISQLQQRKRALFEGVIDAGSGKNSAKLTRADVEQLFAS